MRLAVAIRKLVLQRGGCLFAARHQPEAVIEAAPLDAPGVGGALQSSRIDPNGLDVEHATRSAMRW